MLFSMHAEHAVYLCLGILKVKILQIVHKSWVNILSLGWDTMQIQPFVIVCNTRVKGKRKCNLVQETTKIQLDEQICQKANLRMEANWLCLGDRFPNGRFPLPVISSAWILLPSLEWQQWGVSRFSCHQWIHCEPEIDRSRWSRNDGCWILGRLNERAKTAVNDLEIKRPIWSIRDVCLE